MNSVNNHSVTQVVTSVNCDPPTSYARAKKVEDFLSSITWPAIGPDRIETISKLADFAGKEWQTNPSAEMQCALWLAYQANASQEHLDSFKRQFNDRAPNAPRTTNNADARQAEQTKQDPPPASKPKRKNRIKLNRRARS